MKNFIRTRVFARSLLASSFLLALTGNAQAEKLVAYNGQIAVFDTFDTLIDSSAYKNIIGTSTGEFFIGMDLRPSTNTIYAVTSQNRIYTVDAYTGVSSFVANLSQPVFESIDNFLVNSYGLDFNPIAERTSAASMRLVSDTGDNFSINADTGAVTVGAPIAPGFTDVAFLNSDASNPLVAPVSTELYYINSISRTLASAPSAFNNPTISTVGPLGIDFFPHEIGPEDRPFFFGSGFEITRLGNAYAALPYSSRDESRLYSVNLETGDTFLTGTHLGTFVSALTSAPVSAIPEPKTYAMLLLGLGLIGFIAHRRQLRSYLKS